ncbi:MAG: LacI family DNA-binding transcriptional regulator [Ilumatobacteraceae bacterium]|jgi:LacI family transcriptional regulator
MSTLRGAPGRATIREVAARAGVSVKSVSRVINAEPSVSPELAARVHVAITELGYRHNLAASNLRRRGQRTLSLGVVIQDISNPFAASVLRAVEEVALRRRVVVLASSIDADPQRERQVVDELLRRRVDGMILMPTTVDHRQYADEHHRGVPFVFVDRPPVALDADYVGSDNIGGSREAVAALIRRGHRRIGYIGDTRSISTAIERLEGYRQALAAAGLDERPDLVVQDVNSPGRAERAVHDLLAVAEPPTALFTAQNLVTIGALRVLRGWGLRGRIAHIGFDDVELGELLEPGVSAVCQSPAEIGRTAAELVFARLDGSTEPAQRRIVQVQLVERGSGELAPVRSVV